MSEKFRVSDHAQEEMIRRDVSSAVLAQVMTRPEQIIDAHSRRKIYQSRIKINGKLYLVRVIVDVDDVPRVITVYRTSKIEKYWSENHESDL
jgi:hypothetical protein